MIRNQDDEFNARLIQNGGKIFLIPTIKILYTARSNIKKTCKMFYQFGLFKPLVNRKLKHPATVRQFIPLLFVIYLALIPVSFILSSKLTLFYLLPLFLYLLLNLFFTLKIVLKEKEFLTILITPIIFFLIHLSYGIGYLTGIFKFILFYKKGRYLNTDISR